MIGRHLSQQQEPRREVVIPHRLFDTEPVVIKLLGTIFHQNPTCHLLPTSSMGGATKHSRDQIQSCSFANDVVVRTGIKREVILKVVGMQTQRLDNAFLFAWPPP